MNKKIKNIIIVVFVISSIILGVYFIPCYHIEEIDSYRAIFLPLAIGYILSCIFYYFTVYLHEKSRINEEYELSKQWYEVLLNRLKDCLLYCTLDFNFPNHYEISDVSSSDIYANISALKLLVNTIEDEQFFYKYCEENRLDKKSFDINNKTVAFYESQNIVDLFDEIKKVIIPQLLMLEKNVEIKAQLLDLYSNISDTRLKINSQKDACAGMVFQHFIAFIQVTLQLFEQLRDRK